MNQNMWNLDHDTREDLRNMMRTLRQYGGVVLTNSPRFVPIGASVNPEGEVGLAMTRPDPETTPEDAILGMVRGFTRLAQDGSIRAAGYVEDGPATQANTGTETALILSMECRSGVSVKVEVPYVLDGDQLSFGSSVIWQVPQWLFARDEPATDD